MENQKGCLIVFEGNDGAGKTTALEACAQKLKEQGYPILVSREPGGAPVAEQIRQVLLDPANAMDPKTEALLYAAARREHLVRTILPALENGQVILCDRFLDSSLAYQGYGRKLGADAIEALNDFGLEGFRPDLTLFFALDIETEAKRMARRGQYDRMDLEGKAFHERVRHGFEALCRKNGPSSEHVIIDASKTPEQVLDQALGQIEYFLQSRDSGRDRKAKTPVWVKKAKAKGEPSPGSQEAEMGDEHD